VLKKSVTVFDNFTFGIVSDVVDVNVLKILL